MVVVGRSDRAEKRQSGASRGFSGLLRAAWLGRAGAWRALDGRSERAKCGKAKYALAPDAVTAVDRPPGLIRLGGLQIRAIYHTLHCHLP